MLKPRVEYTPGTFGPCFFELDQRKISEDLCKIRSGTKNLSAKCGGCKSDFRLCRECIKIRIRKLVRQPANGLGLCPECEKYRVPTAGQVTVKPTAPVECVRLDTGAFDGLEVMDTSDKEPVTTRRRGRRTSRVTYVGVSQEPLDTKVIAAGVLLVEQLSNAHKKVFNLLGQGYGELAISNFTKLGEKSVKPYKTAIYRTLGIAGLRKGLKHRTLVAIYQAHIEKCSSGIAAE